MSCSFLRADTLRQGKSQSSRANKGKKNIKISRVHLVKTRFTWKPQAENCTVTLFGRPDQPQFQHAHLHEKINAPGQNTLHVGAAIQNCCSEMPLVEMLRSEALPVGDGRATSTVLALRDPHPQECAEQGQDRPNNPHRELFLWWRNHLDLHRG